MSQVEIIFAEPHKSLRDSHGFKEGQEIKEVSFNVWSYRREVFGLVLTFDADGPQYTYPWHTIARLKITD